MGKAGGETLLGPCRALAWASAAVLCLAAGAEGVILDAMDDATLWNQKSVDGAATLTVSTATGQTGNSVSGSYDLKTGSYAQFGRILSTIDISGGDAISFLYKGTGNKNNIEIKLQDDGGDWFIKVLTDVSDTTDWVRAVIKFKTDFSFAFMEGTSGDTKLSSSAIKKMSFGVTKSAGGSGTLLIDDLTAYQSTADTVVVEIDNHNDGATPNILGGATSGTYVDGSATISTTYDNAAANQPTGDTGTFSLRLDFVKTGTVNQAAWVEAFSSTDFSSCTELVFDIRGAAGSEAVAVGMKSSSAEYLVTLSSYLTSGVTTSWQRARIPLTAFSGVDRSAVTGMTIWFQATSAGAGSYSITANGDTRTIWVDNIRGFKAPTTAAVLHAIDSFEAPVSVSGWTTAYGGDASITVDRATGVVGKAFRLSYAFNSGTYAIMERKVSYNILEGTAFSFYLNGTGGANNIEFKVKDGDGTTYYKVLSGASYTAGAWTRYIIPYTQLAYFSAGTDQTLNLADIARIDYAITKASGTTTGTLAVDDLQYIASPSFNEALPSSGVLENLVVTGNPASPNGDGIDDVVTFQYTLKENSAVTLNVYDMRGNVVRQIKPGTQAAGSQSMSWDVTDQSGRVVRNGLCIFRLDAKGAASGNRSDIRNVIAVVR